MTIDHEFVTDIPIRLTCCFIQDQDTGGFTAFIKEFPQAISQGETMREAHEKLTHALNLLIKHIND